jgi:hypothetical protein
MAAFPRSVNLRQRAAARTQESAADLSRCFLSLANSPNFAPDRFRRYEATLWRHVGQFLFVLDALGSAEGRHTPRLLN